MPQKGSICQSEFERLAALTWGCPGWKTEAAAAIGVSRSTVSRWLEDDKVPGWAAERIRAMAQLAPPPGSMVSEDRDNECAQVMEGELSRLVDLAESAGWHRGEVVAAILSFAIDDNLRHAGKDPALEILEQARSLVKDY